MNSKHKCGVFGFRASGGRVGPVSRQGLILMLALKAKVNDFLVVIDMDEICALSYVKI